MHRDAAAVDEVARAFNRELGQACDYLHNHPHHVLAAVKLVLQIVKDLRRHGGCKPGDPAQPVRTLPAALC